MSHYKPYPAYRESGVEWIGQVPEHWSLLRLANVGALMKANGGNKQDDADRGIPCIRYGDLYTTYDLLIRQVGKFINPDAETDYTAIQYGDILFAASGETFEEIGKSAVNLTQAHACCGGDIIILRPHRKFDPAFLAYAAGSSSSQTQKSLMGKGFTVIHIYGDQLRNIVITAPPEQDQKFIVAKIESETTRIDSLISKKTRFIELLKEKRSALITHAVTKGLNPKAKMKDSGVEWIGEVPEHWRVGAIKFIAETLNGATPESGKAEYWDGDIAWYTPTDIDNEIVTELAAPRRYISKSGFESCAVKLAPLGSVILSTRAPIGSVGTTLVPSTINQGCRTLVPKHNVPTNYLASLLVAARNELRLRGNGTTFQELSTDGLRSLRVPMPPLAESVLIASAVERETSRIDLLIQKTQHSIALLKERRSTFITAAVTGQIDLRESA